MMNAEMKPAVFLIQDSYVDTKKKVQKDFVHKILSIPNSNPLALILLFANKEKKLRVSHFKIAKIENLLCYSIERAETGDERQCNNTTKSHWISDVIFGWFG